MRIVRRLVVAAAIIAVLPDAVIPARPVHDDLVAAGRVDAGSQVDVVRSKIGMAVRAVALSPDISGARNPDGGRALIRCYTSPAVADAIRAAGLEPMTVR